MRFEFASANRIIFGDETLEQVVLARQFGQRALVITGNRPERASHLRDMLANAGIGSDVLPIASEPSVQQTQIGAEIARDGKYDMVIGYGGGSALDAAKAIAAFVHNDDDPYDYLEIVGLARPFLKPVLPIIAIPTTAGTGSEVTRNAVLLAQEQRHKVSIRHHNLLPRLVIVDPTLTRTLPSHYTAMSGMDALTQLVEPYVCNNANPFTDAYALEGLRRAQAALLRAVRDGEDAEARHDMALASLCSGLAMTNSGLGVVHGFAHAIGGQVNIAHGALCGRFLPVAMAINIRALRQREPHNPALARYTHIAQILTDDPNARAEDGAQWVADLLAQLPIPRQTATLYRPDVLVRTRLSNSTQRNPITLTDAELTECLEAVMG